MGNGPDVRELDMKPKLCPDLYYITETAYFLFPLPNLTLQKVYMSRKEIGKKMVLCTITRQAVMLIYHLYMWRNVTLYYYCHEDGH